MVYTAQCTIDGICRSIVQSHASLIAPPDWVFIEVSSLDQSILGKRWTGSVWETVAAAAKLSGLTYDEFRKLFTVAELTILDSCTDDDFMTAMELTPLTVLQKGNIRFLISEAKATGAGQGINLASPKLVGVENPPTPGALDALISYGLLDLSRKAEILAGVPKS